MSWFSTLLRFGVCFAFALHFALDAAVTIAADGELLKLPAVATDAALNPETGDVAIASAVSRQAWILPAAWFDKASVEPIGPLAAAKAPVAVLFKRSGDKTYLVLGGFDSGDLAVLDAATWAPVTSAPPSTFPTVFLSSSDDPNDPWVYVSSDSGRQTRLSAFQIDADTPRLLHVVTHSGLARRTDQSSGAFLVSSSGRWVYALDGDRRSITQLRLHHPTTKANGPTAEQVKQSTAPNPQQPLVRLPFEQGLAQGTAILSPDLDLKPPRALFRAASAIADRPLLIGLANRDLRVVSLISGELAARVILPREMIGFEEQTVAVPYEGMTFRQRVRPIVLADSKRDRLIVLSGQQAYVAPMSALNLPDEPILAASPSLPATVFAEKETTIDVNPSDPRVQVELASGPDGMRLEDGKLFWKPAIQQLGPAEFALRLSYNDASTSRTFKFSVSGQSIPCPFAATQAAIDDAGKRLAIWDGGAPCQFGLLDRAAPQKAITRTFAEPVATALVAGDTVCVLTATDKQAILHRLDPQSLETRALKLISSSPATLRLIKSATLTADDDKTVTYQLSERALRMRQQYLLPDLEQATDAGPADIAIDETGLLGDLPGFIGRVANLGRLGSSPVSQTVPARHAWITYRAHELRSPSKYKQQLAPVTCEALPLRLGVQLDEKSVEGFFRVDLVGRGLLQDEVTHRWPVDLIEAAGGRRDLNVWLSTTRSKAVVVLRGSVYVRDLAEAAEMQSPGPFKLLPDHPPLLANLDGPTRLHYAIEGGKPPYAMEISLPHFGAGSAGESDWVTRAPGVDRQFDADAPGYVSSQIHKIGGALAEWSQEALTAERIMTAYRDSVAVPFEKLTGQKPVGIPIAIPVIVTAYDSQNQTQRLSHYLLADIPREMLEVDLNAAVFRRWPGTPAALQARKALAGVRVVDPSSELVRFSQQWRRNAARPQVSPEQLRAAAQDALERFEQRWRQSLLKQQEEQAPRPLRIWTDNTGNKVNARLVQYFAGQVVVSLERGAPLAFSIDDLSQADQKYVRDATAPPERDTQAEQQSALLREAKLRQVVMAAHRFHDIHRFFPPSALIDEEGKPLTSWRVVLLQTLGAQELFSLFRLEEPWDSEHNMVLAEYMPSVFRLADVDTEPHQTPILRLIGENTAAPPGRLVRIRDIIDGTSNTLFAVVGDKQHAVVWTKPQDLTIEGDETFGGKLHWRDDTATLLMCDGTVQPAKPGDTPDIWLRRARLNDLR